LGTSRAFSLIELVLIAVIIGIVTAIALPRFSGALVRQRADAAARRIVADLALARRQARASSSSQTVKFSGASGSYELVGMSHPDHPAEKYKVYLYKEPYSARQVSADFGGDNEILFDGWGAPDSGGSVVIQVGDNSRTISVDPETGEASIE
jgi:type II secretory pathway pseudopilin PulG